VAVVLGSPAYARWYPNDRFGLALWGLTGSRKSSAMLVALSMFGVGYADKDRMLKSDEQSSTPTACGDIAAGAGIMPQSYDNVKTVDDRQLKKYVSFVHGTLEGSEKDRSKKDGGLRDTRAYLCTLIITGEVRPQEASTTARILNLTWSDVDLEKLSFLQENVDDMPVIGYYWLRFLSKVSGMDGFRELRSKMNAEFSKKQYTNPGRLATNYSLIRETWTLLCRSPFGDVFSEYSEKFEQALTEAFEEQGSMVSEETEVSRFLAGVTEIIASKPESIQSNNDSKNAFNRPVEGKLPNPAYIIGKRCDDGLFLLPDKILAELDRMRVFTQKPTEDSMSKALRARGALIIDPDGKHLKVKRRLNVCNVRGWLLTPEAIEMDPPSGNDKNNNTWSDDPTEPTFPPENEE